MSTTNGQWWYGYDKASSDGKYVRYQNEENNNSINRNVCQTNNNCINIVCK